MVYTGGAVSIRTRGRNTWLIITVVYVEEVIKTMHCYFDLPT